MLVALAWRWGIGHLKLSSYSNTGKIEGYRCAAFSRFGNAQLVHERSMATQGASPLRRLLLKQCGINCDNNNQRGNGQCCCDKSDEENASPARGEFALDDVVLSILSA